MSGPLEGPRDGSTFDSEVDLKPLNWQMLRVYGIVSDEDWHTLADISAKTGDPEASVSARLRDFKKPKFGNHGMYRRRIHGRLYEYRVEWNPGYPRPSKSSYEEAWKRARR